ncbi:MAG: acyltransferase [Alphaproteobacteria bacterium]|nr:MAG: acyltransferase [Alphaproteobacteria bacterium]TAF13126.1 MAG: acyltransferase [Alphaproteobacteria bacterium]TAF40660.1 MAG: acyltransferase [Alphaproteobacteria bacterium]TAF77393.1 MAG: acyltransferase [Alphaproteobacteria bacterium]
MPDMQQWDDVVHILLFQQGAGHLWTIPVECIFYAWLPLLAWGLSTLHKHYGCIAMMGCCLITIAIHQYYLPFWDTPNNSIVTLWYLPCFMCGSASALIHDRCTWMHRYADMIIFCLLGLILCFSPLLGHGWLPPSMTTLFSTYHLPLGLMWAIIIMCVLHGSGIATRLMCWRGIIYLGKWSYPIYLMHWIIYLKLVALYPNNLIAMIGAILCSMITGAVMHYALERPIERWRHHHFS